MKKKIALFTIIFLSLPLAFCTYANSDAEKLSDIKSILKAAEPDYFPDTVKIIKLGTISKESNVYITKLIWGNSRETKRLVLISKDGTYLGNYYLDEIPDKIVDNKIIFNVDPKWGNIIDFSKGIPDEIYIDGHSYGFDRAKELQVGTTSVSAAQELGTNSDVTLSGTLIIRVFTDANNNHEKALILVLDKPIDVKKDDMGGPAKNINEVQLSIMNEAARAVAKEYINKKVLAAGLLYYGHTAHHHTKVLMAVNQLDRLH